MTQRRSTPLTGRSQRLAVCVALVAVSLGLGTALPRARAADRGSARTVSGSGEFSSLKVTVSQTQGLVNQSLNVSWSGADPTPGTVGQFSANFLQLMQCWGDDPDAADFREQCQYGGLGEDGTVTASGSVAKRTVFTKDPWPGSPSPHDPAETLTPTRTFDQNTAYVPFRPASGEAPIGGNASDTPFKDFFNVNTTNEVFGRTAGDGTGQAFFEAQTLTESHGLGCGAPRKTATGDTVGRRCWLVIVPRGTHEVDGSVSVGGGNAGNRENWLKSSPLNASNFAHRLVVPLDFEPVGGSCSLGRAERPTIGSETAADAVLRWQPALCAGGGAVFSYSSTAELLARRKLTSGTPALVFTKRPLAPEDVVAGRVPAYAPVLLSGVGIAFSIERRTVDTVAADLKARDGERVTDLSLTPRLIAKLLTQSYQLDAQRAPSVAGNPVNITKDPEFLAVNPQFADLSYPDVSLLVSAGMSDSAGQLWDLIASDPEAAAFLAGTPDPFGMKVNPVYRELSLPRDGFPKLEPYCLPIAVGEGYPDQPFCTLDWHPYANGLRHGAQSAARGSTLTRNPVIDPLSGIVKSKLDPPQPAGQRAVLAFTDTASAARYGLPMAKIRNAAGNFVAPTNATLLEALAGMAPSGVPGVLAPDPLLGGTAYPLPSLTYAATVPALLAPDAAKDYATFIRYAVGSGQMSGEARGELPAGYVPLPQRTRDQALDLAFVLTHPQPVAGSSSTSAVVTPSAPAPVPSSRAATVAAPAAPGVTPSGTPSVPASVPPPAVSPAPVAVLPGPTASMPTPSASPAPPAESTSSTSAVSTLAPATPPTSHPKPPSASPTPAGVRPVNGGLPALGGHPSRLPSFTGVRHIGRLPAGNPIVALAPTSAGSAAATPGSTAPSPSAAGTAQAPDIQQQPGPVELLSVPLAATPPEPLGPQRYAVLAFVTLGLVAMVCAGAAPALARLKPYGAPVSRAFARVRRRPQR